MSSPAVIFEAGICDCFSSAAIWAASAAPLAP